MDNKKQPGNLPRVWDKPIDGVSRVISERIPDDTVLEITASFIYFQKAIGNNVTIKAKGSVTVLDTIGHGVTILSGDYVRISADAGDNLVVKAQGAEFRKVGRNAVISAEKGVHAISFGAGSVVDAKGPMLVRDLCGPGCRFIAPVRHGLGMNSPECLQQNHRPNQFWRSTLGLR